MVGDTHTDTLIAAYAKQWAAYQITDASLRANITRILAWEAARQPVTLGDRP